MRTTLLLLIVILILITMIAPPLAAETVLWVPAAASNSGAHGTEWTTDLWIYNQVMDQPLTVYLAFLPHENGVTDPVEIPVEVPVWDYVYIQDVVGSLFGENRSGAIRLRADYVFEATSRTFNTGGDVGTYGQGIPAVAASTTTVGAILLGASNRPTANGTRTNLGLLNTSSERLKLWVAVSGSTMPSAIGEFTEYWIEPLGWWQGNLFELVGAGSVAVDNAVVTVINPRNDQTIGTNRSVISYLSVVDNASGDGTYVEPVDAAGVFTLPVDWVLDFTVDAASNVTVHNLTVTIEDSEPEVFTDLSEGAQVTLESHVGEFEMCYSVDATASGGQSGRVTVEYEYTPSYGSPGHHLHSEGGWGDFTINDCDWIQPEPRVVFPDP